MKGIFVRYNLENENWTDEEWENQPEREIFLPIEVIREYVINSDKACSDKDTTVLFINKIKEVQ